MKFFKMLKRKAGNAIIPVIGTILGLTILAGTVVGVALNSSKLVYKQDNLENQNDARQILYIASKYFCTEINKQRDPAEIRAELQGFFGPGLKITQDKSDTEKFYIWYPNKYKVGNEYTTDENVAEWLKATIKKVEGDDDNSDHGNTGINDTLFKEEAKLDEKFAIGNMMTVYLTDEKLLPGRAYSINEVSLIESDIDTFDEAFTYMNNTGVLEIDNIYAALYAYGVANSSSTSSANITYTAVNNDDHYYIVYETGNLGGNYYWQDSKGTDYETKLYRQEYDIDMLWGMITHEDPSLLNKLSKSNLKYRYDETNDRHYIYSSNEDDNYRVVYYSTLDFAQALSEYVFWINLPRLSLNLNDFKTQINNAATNFVKNRADLVDQFSYAYDWKYEWKNTSLTVFVYWQDNWGKGWYSEYDINDVQIVNFYQTNSVLKDKYCTGNKLDLSLLYNALLTQKKSSYMSANEEAIQSAYEAIIKKRIITERKNRKNGNNYILMTYSDWGTERTTTRESWADYFYYWDNNAFLNYTQNSRPAALEQAVQNLILNRLNIKYVTGTEGKDPAPIGGKVVTDIIEDGLKSFRYVQVNQGEYYTINYQFGYHFEIDGRIDSSTQDSEQSGDTIFIKRDGIYQGTDKIISFTDTKSATETFVKAFIESFASICGVSIGDIYSEEEITTKSHDQLKKELLANILYQYLPTSTLGSILGTNSTTKAGMKQDAINNKLVTYYLDNTTASLDQQIKELIQEENLGYTIKVSSASYATNNSTTYNDCLDYRIAVEIKIDGYNKITRYLSFMIKFLTKSPLNTMNIVDGEYQLVPNTNVTEVEDSDGTTKYLFSDKVIYNQNKSPLTKSDIAGGKVETILTAIPYTERINSNQVKYKDHKITIDGKDYTVTYDVQDLVNVTSNTLYAGDLLSLPSDNFTITVAKDTSLFINGKFALNNNQKIYLGQNALLFVNGNFSVKYDVRVDMGRVGKTYYARQLTTTDIASFQSQGVDIHAAKDAKIMVNGNFDYRGYKAKVATADNNGYIKIWNDPHDSSLDRVFEQYVLSTGFIQKEDGEKACDKDSSGVYHHYDSECRGLLEGIYIVNGDLVFHAWDEKNITSNANKQVYAMYRNMYSNPLVNGTFYVDGAFDMRGLYTSGLYDQCRANFVFAKSIIEPAIALNTILCAGQDTQYGAWDETDGYLFMICEDAIDFSKVNFACVNLFTPFMELVNAINENKASELNFSDFVKRDEFLDMYPNKKVIDEWGLPSILRTGFGEIYSPGDIQTIKPEEQFNAAGDTVI